MQRQGSIRWGEPRPARAPSLPSPPVAPPSVQPLPASPQVTPRPAGLRAVWLEGGPADGEATRPDSSNRSWAPPRRDGE